MGREDKVFRDKNDLIFSVLGLIDDATKRSKQTGAGNSSSPDAEPLEQGKDEPPRHQVEKEL